ncbi:MAG: hypothetical protein KAU21_03945, partial [Gammaproteobacteria bacterium]|nr:hypothetical protein [Gammaproteobacteria bacterium]
MNGLRFLISAAMAATVFGCEETPNTTVQDAAIESGFFAQLDSKNGIIPFPNNLLLPVGALVNIPIPDLDTECSNIGEIVLKTTLNDLDGFSTTAPITAPFTSAVDTSSLVIGSNVRVFEVSLGGSGEVTGITRELDTTEFVVGISSVNNEISGATNAITGELCDTADIGANKLVISPLKPLTPKTSYLVALTNDIGGPNGLKAAASAAYAFAKTTTPLLSAFPPTSLSDALYAALTSTSDLDGDGVVDVDVNEDGVIDAADTVEVLTTLGNLEGLRQLTNASEGWIEAYTVTIDNAGADTITDLQATDIIMSWTFTTQSAGDVLADVRVSVVDGAVPATVLVDTQTDSPLAAADLYAGTLETTYYLHVPTSTTDATDADSPTSGSWRATGDIPVTQYTAQVATSATRPQGTAVTIPLMVSIPKTGSAPWPVVIFQHGITGNRTNMLGMVDTMAGAGYAVVAIDMPLHGLTGCEASGVGAYKTTIERTFDVDFKDNATEVTPDEDNCPANSITADIDPSGTHFINLESLLTSRDNVRQAVADLFVLTKSLEGMDYDGGGADFDLDNIHFVGHSLGGIVGGVFLALEPTVKSSVLGMAGGGIAKLLDGSATFGPILEAGLGANGVTKGFAQYESFMASAQMVLDSGDPINYTANTVTGRGVLLLEVVGDGVDNLPDQVIPNNVFSIA